MPESHTFLAQFWQLPQIRIPVTSFTSSNVQDAPMLESPIPCIRLLALHAFVTDHSAQRTRHITFAIFTQRGCLCLKYHACPTESSSAVPQSLPNSCRSYNTNSPALIPQAELNWLAWFTVHTLPTSVHDVLHLFRGNLLKVSPNGGKQEQWFNGTSFSHCSLSHDILEERL